MQAILVDPKVVTNLVQESLARLSNQLLLGSAMALVRSLVDVDGVRGDEIVTLSPVCQGNSDVEAEEIAVVADFGSI